MIMFLIGVFLLQMPSLSNGGPVPSNFSLLAKDKSEWKIMLFLKDKAISGVMNENGNIGTL